MKLVVIGERNAFQAVRNNPQVLVIMVETLAGVWCAVFDDCEIGFLKVWQGFCLCVAGNRVIDVSRK
jgi:hypothetical protein